MASDRPALPGRQADQRQQWRKAISGLHRQQRNQRGRRRAAVITGIRIPAQRKEDT